MQAKDLETLQSIKLALEGKELPQVEPERILNPAQEVEKSLVNFLRHRLDKLQEAASFEDNIKDVILSRIAEAKFSDLTYLLEIIQRNNNVATEKVLAPFIAQNGAPSPLLPSQADGQRDNMDALLKGQDEKKVLQALSALNQLVGAVTKSTQPTE
jgi:hypothetical protein